MKFLVLLDWRRATVHLVDDSVVDVSSCATYSNASRGAVLVNSVEKAVEIITAFTKTIADD